MLLESMLTAILSVMPAAAATNASPRGSAKTPATAAVTQSGGKTSKQTKVAAADAAKQPATDAKKPATSAPAPSDAKQAAPSDATSATKPTAPSAAAPSPATASAKPPMTAEVKALVDRMQEFYEKTDDFTADFDQKYSYKKFKRVQQSSGSVIFKKPGVMRWEYLKPSPKSFILAGDKVYAYDPQAMLLTKASIDTTQLSASVTFLFGKGKLADEFSIDKAACSDCKGTLLQLTPLKPDPRFKKILLEADPKTAQVLRSTVIDPDGSENEITFKNLKTNTGVTEAAFKLNPPEGTQVQDYTKQPAAQQPQLAPEGQPKK